MSQECPITLQFEHPYTHFSFFLALPYALCGSIKLYTGIESLECQELAMSCCRAFGGSSVNHRTRELCGGVDSCNCISICWYSLARCSKLLFLLASVLLLSISPWISCPGRASFSGICLNRGSRLVDAVVILG